MSEDARVAAAGVTAVGVPLDGEVRTGDDLAGLLLEGVRAAGLELRDGDLLAVSSKVVSKAEGRFVRADARDGAVDAETVRIVAERVTPRGTTRVVESRSGPVLAAAGVDASNVPAGTVLLLPEDPDASARALRRELRRRTGRQVAVLVTDTLGRPWRDGQVDAALGAAGLCVVDDLRGGVDGHGNRLEVTVRALADEAAAMADLVKGKLDGVPAAILRGLEAWVTPEDGPGAASLLRTGSQDWFRYGHVEAVRTSLGTSPGWPGVPAVPLPGGTAAERLQRALDVALASPHWPAREQAPAPWVLVAVEALPEEGDVAQAALVPHPEATAWELICLGALGQRVLALAWAEGLDAVVVERFHDPEPSVAIRAVIRPV